MSTSRDYRSLISYSITKPYPYRWFTPVATVALIVLAVLVSILNYYSSGFALTVTSTINPNSTINTYASFGRWPSLNSHAHPTRQAHSIAVNDKFFTNQTALTYTLTGVWQNTAPQVAILPALDYFNNVIESCTINGIAVDMTSLDRTGNQIAYSMWGQTVRTYITCSIQTRSGTVHFNLTQSYDYVPENINLSLTGTYLGTDFLNRDANSRASLWWGESCMSAYWGLLCGRMEQVHNNQTNYGQAAIRKGTLLFTFASDAVTDITSLDFFSVDFRFITDYGRGVFSVVHLPTYFPGDDGPRRVSELHSISTYPDIWTLTDGLAKVTYSTVLTDLGQVSVSPNILTNATSLQEYTTTIGNGTFFRANTAPGPATAPYNNLKAVTGSLQVTPSVISGIYLCSVPQRKSLGDLIVSILVADLVFLQAFWVIYKLVVELLFLRKRRDAYSCRGCEARDTRDQNSVSDSSSLLSRVDERATRK